MDEKRFVRTYRQGNTFTNLFEIWVDRKTGVNYVFTQSGYGAGLTPLLDREGKPVVSAVSPGTSE